MGHRVCNVLEMHRLAFDEDTYGDDGIEGTGRNGARRLGGCLAEIRGGGGQEIRGTDSSGRRGALGSLKLGSSVEAIYGNRKLTVRQCGESNAG